MKLLLMILFLAAHAHAELVTITLPNGTTASVPGTGPVTSAEAVLASWVTQKVQELQKQEYVHKVLEVAKDLSPARRILILKAIQKISTTTVGGLQTISNAVDAAP